MHLDKIKQFFEDLKFDERSHSYIVNNRRLGSSVSDTIKSFTEKVDFNAIARAIDKRDGLPQGTTRKLWNHKGDVARTIGNKVHYFAEMYTFNRNIKPTDLYEEAVVKFWDSIPPHIIPVETELRMYHKEKLFGGTLDLLLYNTETDKYIIGDYKTNEHLFKNYKEKKLLPPFEFLLDNQFNKYQIQFSLYQILFEQIGLEVETRKLIWVKRDGGLEVFDTQDLRSQLKKYLNNE